MVERACTQANINATTGPERPGRDDGHDDGCARLLVSYRGQYNGRGKGCQRRESEMEHDHWPFKVSQERKAQDSAYESMVSGMFFLLLDDESDLYGDLGLIR